MIFAAGLGTRLRPLTNDRPKALVEVHGKSLLEWVLLKVKAAGIQYCVINVHHFADKIEDFLQKHENFGLEIHISDERDFLLETGGGIKFASHLLQGDSPILIHNADVISDLNLASFIQSHIASDALASMAVSNRNTSRYLRFDEADNLCAWENVKTREIRSARTPVGDTRRLAFSGIHLIDPTFLSLIEEEGKFSIIDVYLRLAQSYSIKAYEHNSQNWFDVGKPENLSPASAYLEETNPY